MDNKIRILIIEDEALIAQNIKLTLEDFGYEIADTCYNYDDALKSIRQNNFDVLILDINLGEPYPKTGLDIAALLPVTKDVPFIFLTAFSDRDTILKATKLNPSAYLVKPVNEGSLFAAIQTAIANFIQKKPALMPGEKQEIEKSFYTKLGNRYIKVNWSDVYAISSGKNYCMLITPQNQNGYPIRSSLQQALQTVVPLLLKSNFVYVTRNMAIQKNIIKEIVGTTITTAHGNFESTKHHIDEILNNETGAE